MVVNIEKLERILIAKWAEFLDVREIMKLVEKQAKVHLSVETLEVQRVTVSRFELSEDGFLVWVESVVNLPDQTEKVNMTSEFYLLTNGIFRHMQTI
jgi:hypothetical protein